MSQTPTTGVEVIHTNARMLDMLWWFLYWILPGVLVILSGPLLPIIVIVVDFALWRPLVRGANQSPAEVDDRYASGGHIVGDDEGDLPPPLKSRRMAESLSDFRSSTGPTPEEGRSETRSIYMTKLTFWERYIWLARFTVAAVIVYVVVQIAILLLLTLLGSFVSLSFIRL